MGFNGDMYAVLPGAAPRIGGTATMFDPTPEAAKTLHLFVADDRALVGVTGGFVAVVDLTTAPIASDVLVGVAFMDDDFAQCRVTAYKDFGIWEIA